MSSDRWDIVAKLPEGATQDQVPDMLLALLDDRFKLAYHRENKQRPVYALVVGKGGAKLKDTSSDPDIPVPDAADTVVYERRGTARCASLKRPGGAVAEADPPPSAALSSEP